MIGIALHIVWRRTVLMGANYGGSWQLSAAGTRAIVDFALGEVMKMVGSQARDHFVKGHPTGWTRDLWTKGAYAAARLGQCGAHQTAG